MSLSTWERTIRPRGRLSGLCREGGRGDQSRALRRAGFSFAVRAWECAWRQTRFPGIRAGICHDTYSAHQGVEHDDMNVLVLGARIIGSALAFELAHTFIAASSRRKRDDLRGGSRKCWQSRPSISVSRRKPGVDCFHREPIDCQGTNPAFAEERQSQILVQRTHFAKLRSGQAFDSVSIENPAKLHSDS